MVVMAALKTETPIEARASRPAAKRVVAEEDAKIWQRWMVSASSGSVSVEAKLRRIGAAGAYSRR